MKKNLVNLIDINNGEFVEGASIPTLKILDEEGNVRGYLQPFRGYRFQVSGSVKGDGDHGSSEVLGLANIVTGVFSGRATAKNPDLSIWASNSSDICVSLLEALAWNALDEYTGHAIDIVEENTDADDDKNIAYVCRTFELREKVHELAKKTVAWINSLL